MKYMHIVALTVLVLGGCARGSNPAIISDLEQDKVIVRQNLGTTDDAVLAKAREGCALHNRIPRALSKVCRDQYCLASDHLFACLEN